MEPVKCPDCGQYPGFTKQCFSEGIVYWALECDCKTTPYYRSQSTVEGIWASTTSKQSRKDAFETAKANTITDIAIFVPSGLVDYKEEATKILSEVFRDGMDDKEWSEFLTELFKESGMSLEKVAEDLLTGVRNGHSIEVQRKAMQALMK